MRLPRGEKEIQSLRKGGRVSETEECGTLCGGGRKMEEKMMLLRGGMQMSEGSQAGYRGAEIQQGILLIINPATDPSPPT